MPNTPLEGTHWRGVSGRPWALSVAYKTKVCRSGESQAGKIEMVSQGKLGWESMPCLGYPARMESGNSVEMG